MHVIVLLIMRSRLCTYLYHAIMYKQNQMTYCVLQNTDEPSVDNDHVDESVHNDNIDEDEVGILLKLFH